MKNNNKVDGYNNLKTYQFQILCHQIQDIGKISYGLRNRIFYLESNGNSGLKNNNVMKKN